MHHIETTHESIARNTRAQARRWQLLKALGWGFAGLGLSVAASACSDSATAPADNPTNTDRAPLGKAVADAGTCVAACGGISNDICWCDELCATIGDCCSDFQETCVAPPDNAAQVLCEATSGGWEGDRCECQQDGYTTNLNFWFDPEKGCVPGEPTPVDEPTLCQDTGGVWEDGACACAQDGSTLFHVFQPEIGCAFPDDAPLRDVILNQNAGVFFTNHMPVDGDGLFIIDRPGVADIVTHYKTNAEAIAALTQFDWINTVSADGACTEGLQTEIFPTVSCEDDAGMNPSGCHYLSTYGVESLSAQMALTNEYEFTNYSAEEIAAAAAAEQTILRVFIDSRNGVTFGFTFKAGAWRLVMIDLQRYSCSA